MQVCCVFDCSSYLHLSKVCPFASLNTYSATEKPSFFAKTRFLGLHFWLSSNAISKLPTIQIHYVFIANADVINLNIIIDEIQIYCSACIRWVVTRFI